MPDIAPYIDGILAAYAILLVGGFSPGPSVAMLVGIATGQGRAPALSASLGIAFGSSSINMLTILGVGLLLAEVAWAMSVLRIAGAAYLLYLACGAFRKAINPETQPSIHPGSRTLLKHFVAGYLLQVSNPKAIAFWLAIASIGAVEGATCGVIVLFVLGAFLISFACHAIWALSLSVGPVRRAYASGRRYVESVLGCFFATAAFKLATADAG